MPRRAGSGGDERGAALALALWLVLVVGMASLQILAEVRVRVDAAALTRSRTISRYAAESGVVAAQALLDDLVRNAGSPADRARVFEALEQTVQGWGQVPLGAGRYQVVVEDLSGRIDLNRSDPEILEGLLAQFVSRGRAGQLVRTLRGIGLEEDAGEPGPLMEDAGVDRGPALMHLEELTRVPGFGDSLSTLIAPYVTVRGDGLINVNSAPEPVLAAIPYVGDVRAQSVVAARETTGPLASRVDLYSALSEGAAQGLDPQLPGLVTESRRVLVIARGWEEGHPYTHEIQAVLEVITSSLAVGPRARVHGWTERGR